MKPIIEDRQGFSNAGELFAGAYPPADPINDNPDTLPDPGGDPQEVVFKWETFKAIRSDESLLK